MCSIGKPSGDGGFTVLELLVAMTLLAAVATAVAVWIPDIGDRTAVERATSLLEREMARLRADAARTGHDRTMTLEGHGFALMLRAGDKVTELDATLTAKWTAAREAGSSERQGSITFWSLGGASGGTFEVSRGRAHAAIDIDWLTGKSRRRK